MNSEERVMSDKLRREEMTNKASYWVRIRDGCHVLAVNESASFTIKSEGRYILADFVKFYRIELTVGLRVFRDLKEHATLEDAKLECPSILVDFAKILGEIR